MSNTRELSLTLPIGSLEGYRSAIEAFPILTKDEERELAERYRSHEDLDAAWRLVTSHLRFVVRIARGYNGYGLAQADLVQEGNVGLMKAVKRFDPDMGVRLVSFAVHWIRAEMHEFILKNWRIVKVATTKAQRKLFFNLRSAKKRLGWMNLDEVRSVAEDLGVTTNDVLEMEKRLSAFDASFDGFGDTDAETERPAPMAYLEDRRCEPAQTAEEEEWEEYTNTRLADAMQTLDERSRDIVQRRWLGDDKSTLHELAAEYGISAERIRQLEKNAMKKMKGLLS